MNTSFNVFALSRRGNPLARLGWQANSLLVTATLILSAFPAGFALADTTTFLSPTDEGDNHNEWTSGSNAFSSNNVYATESSEDDDQSYEDFNFSIPASSRIDGIEVRFEGFNSDSSGCQAEIRMWSASDGQHSNYKTQAVTGSDTVYTLGSGSDLWGATWEQGDFSNGNFHVEIRYDDTSGNSCSGSFSLDHIEVNVHYTLPYTITASAGANGSISPSGAVAATPGEDETFYITPSAGYIVEEVLVDAAPQGRVNEYTFTNVSANHTISATFENGWYDAADATDPGGNDVTNEDGMLSSDNSRANFDSSNDEAELEDFDFVSPLGGVIEGFEVAIEAQGDATVRTLEVSLSWDGGSTFTTVQDTGVFTTQEKTVILGGPTDDWGRTWSLSEISNANFRVMVNATSNSGGSGDDIDVDQVQVKVHYATDNTPPSGGSIDYTDGYYTTASVPVTYTLGTDGESGLNTASGKIQRASAALLSGGSCDTFGSFSDLVTESDGSYDDNSVTTGNCYMYQYVIEDNAGNEATYTSSNVAQVDTVAPTVAIDTQIVVANPTNINPIPMEITFSEDVTGFDDTDIAIVGGTVSNFAAVNDAEYTFDLVPDTDPITMTVNIAGSVATDLAGNANTAATQFARTYNSTALSVTITSGPADGDVINVNNTAFSFTTDGDEAGCAIDSNPVIGADLCTSFVAPAGSHTLAGPLGEGLHTFAVKVAKAGFVDVLLETDFTVDTTQPTVALSSPWIIGGFASTSPLTIDVLFSDAVTDFLDGDVTAVGGVLGTLSGSGASYALDITIGADGPVTVDVAAGVANEANGSGWMNLAAPQLAFVFDGTPPVIDILSGPTDGSSINVFSDSFDFTVTDANVVDVSCSFDNGATSTPCTSPQGFGPFADGVHTFLIYAIDEAGNFAEKLTSFTIDTVLPVVSEVTAIGTTTDTTPDYIFNSSEEGTFVLGGACSTGSSSGASGDNTITLDTLSVGTYTDCTVTLTDDAGNVSNILDISDFTIEAPSSGGGGGGGGGGSLSNPPQAQSTPIPGFTGPTGGNTGGQVLGASTEFSGDSQVGDGEETGGTGDSQNSGGQVLGASTETGGGAGTGAQDEVVEDETGTTTDESSAMSDAQKAAAGLALKGVPAWLIAILIVLIALGLWFGWRWYNRS